MTYEDFLNIVRNIKPGTQCTILWNNEAIEARLQLQHGSWYLCQNAHNGYPCDDKLGYHYSWSISSTHDLLGITDIIPYSLTPAKKVPRRTLIKQVNDGFLAKMSNYLNRALKDLDYQIENREKQIKYNQERNKLLNEDIKKFKSQKTSPKTLTISDLNRLLKQLDNHAMIDEAYISKFGNLIVKTLDLISIDPIYNKVTHKNIGRFTINIDLNGGIIIHVMNRDWKANDYPHPNIDRDYDICWGNNSRDIGDLKQAGDLYLLVDFIIRFFSTYPHDSDNPYIEYEAWLEERSSTTNTNFIEDKL